MENLQTKNQNLKQSHQSIHKQTNNHSKISQTTQKNQHTYEKTKESHKKIQNAQQFFQKHKQQSQNYNQTQTSKINHTVNQLIDKKVPFTTNEQQIMKKQISSKNIQKQSKLQKMQQKSISNTQSQQSLDTGKRTRDWQKNQTKQNQIKDNQIKISFKKIYQFCDGSIIFNVDPQYELQKLIGSGIYGIVASGKNKITNQPVAIKKISKLFNNFGDTRRVLRQIKVLQFLNHKNIIALQGIMIIQNPATFNQIYLIMEYMEFDLRRLIQSQMKITQQMIKFIMYQLLVSINFMHSADILHRDLKPENILMNKKCELKLADMNLARKQTYTGNITDYVASRPYRAPQILIGSTDYNKSVDIWSIGCIFAELLGKTIIFHGKDYIDQLKRFVAILGKPKIQYFPNIDKTSMQSLVKLISQIPDKQKVQWKYLMPNISDKAADLLDHMLTYDSRNRFNAEQCLNHPYLEEYKKAPRIKCKQTFDFSFDKIQLKQEALRKAIYNAAQQFNAKKIKIEEKINPVIGQDTVKKQVKSE